MESLSPAVDHLCQGASLIEVVIVEQPCCYRSVCSTLIMSLCPTGRLGHYTAAYTAILCLQCYGLCSGIAHKWIIISVAHLCHSLYILIMLYALFFKVVADLITKSIWMLEIIFQRQHMHIFIPKKPQQKHTSKFTNVIYGGTHKFIYSIHNCYFCYGQFGAFLPKRAECRVALMQRDEWI